MPSPGLAPSPPSAKPDLGAIREWLANSPEASPCNLATLVVFLGRAYAACREDGLLVIAMQPSPTLIQRRNLGGEVIDLFEQGGALAASVKRPETQWVAGVAEAPTVAPVSPPPLPPPAPPPPPPRKLLGRVVRIQGQRVLIDLGKEDGVDESVNVQLLSQEPDGTQRVLAVGPVRATSEHHSLVELGLNEEAPLDSIAKATTEPVSASRAAPPRTSAPFTANVLLRPFIGLSGSGGGGLLLDASIVRRFRAPFKIGAALEPFGYGGTSGRTTTTFSGMVFGTYETKVFEGGFGLGVQTVNDNALYEPGTGTMIPLLVRFGSADGANVHGRVDLTLFHSEVLLTGLRLELDVMVDRGTWLLLGGGGGDSGYAFGEVGLRKLLTGNGNRGSHYLILTVGGSALSQCTTTSFEFQCGTVVDTNGAHLGVGMESRF